MKKLMLKTIEKKHDLSSELVLIVDKEGIIGGEILQSMRQETPDIHAVFVSSKNFPVERGNILIVPYDKKLPILPNGQYAYIIVVVNGEKELVSAIPLFVKKGEEAKAKCVFILPIELYDKELIEEIILGYKEAFVICLGDVFAKDLSIRLASPIQKLLAKAFYKGDIELSEMGLTKVRPVFLEDALDCILEVVFSSSKITRIFYAFQEHSPTLLSVARIIQKLEPTVRVDFVERQPSTEPQRLLEGTYILANTYPLEKHIKSVFTYMENSKDKKEFVPILKQKSVSYLPYYTFLLGVFIIWILLLPLLVSGVFGFFGATQVSSVIKAIEKGEFTKAQDASSIALSSFAVASRSMQLVSLQAQYIGKLKQAETIQRKITLAIVTTTAMRNLAKASSHAMAFIVDEKGTEKDFTEARQSLYQTLVSLQQLYAEYPEFRQSIQVFPTDRIAATMSTFPDLFGFEGKRVYLVLFQNNMELRPGGGFIGSYGLLSLDKGVVEELTIHNVYDADGQLKGHVEPPFPLRRYLPTEHWYMRDSNFSADFKKSASSAAYFLNLETNKTVDGVIAVDVSFLQSVLEALGPVYVAEYKETVTAKNVFELTQKHAEKDSFPGSMQKKDFLSALFRSIEQAAGGVKKEIAYPKLLRSLENAILQKHLLFAFSNSSLSQTFAVNNMSSTLADSRKEEEATINDFLGISEANLGVNKVNYYIARKVEYSVALQEGIGVIGSATIHYANNANADDKANSKLIGDYKNYLRIIVPLNAKLQQVIIDGQDQQIVPAVTNPVIYERKNFLPPKGLEVEESIEEGKTVFGALINVPIGKTKKVTFVYSLPGKLPKDSLAAIYSLKLFKQPGTQTYPFSLTLQMPKTYKVLSVSEGVKEIGENLVYKQNLEKDEDIEVGFAKR